MITTIHRLRDPTAMSPTTKTRSTKTLGMYADKWRPTNPTCMSTTRTWRYSTPDSRTHLLMQLSISESLLQHNGEKSFRIMRTSSMHASRCSANSSRLAWNFFLNSFNSALLWACDELVVHELVNCACISSICANTPSALCSKYRSVVKSLVNV